MTPKKKWESIGFTPISSRTALGIQSKAVYKYTQFLECLSTPNTEILLTIGVEAVLSCTK
jgi:hypothetical protein